MKLHRLLILSGLLLTVAPAASFAACSPACAEGVSCRITAQGPPTVYQCDTAFRAVRGGPRASVGGVAVKGGTSGDSLRSGTVPRASDPKLAEATAAKKGAATITSPRDPASGQATGKSN